MQWYYSKNGTQLGPVPQGELLAKLASGEVSTTELVWKEGMADWIPASQVAELKVGGGPASSVAPGSSLNPQVSPYSPPSAVPAPAGDGANIPNYLWQSIVVTLLCCMPFGIVGIVNAAKVDALKAKGDYAEAAVAAANAKKWCKWGVIGAVIVWVLYIGFIALVATRQGIPQAP